MRRGEKIKWEKERKREHLRVKKLKGKDNEERRQKRKKVRRQLSHRSGKREKIKEDKEGERKGEGEMAAELPFGEEREGRKEEIEERIL
ncbi:hypothetical protein AMTR_s00150p00074700 [Amborella trichopoda]|uniref:Uncharacterized protein n=1 Tax=Amborella trichopoda TaxID=13333 RepID=W1PL99_AMBTC|nr:hypothetical protein AMTR_s00150p00074700 [Amborella trichopoda]